MPGAGGGGLILHVSATEGRVLRLAEAIGVKKRDSEGVVREFEADRSGDFPRNGVVGPLTISGVQLNRHSKFRVQIWDEFWDNFGPRETQIDISHIF